MGGFSVSPTSSFSKKLTLSSREWVRSLPWCPEADLPTKVTGKRRFLLERPEHGETWLNSRKKFLELRPNYSGSPVSQTPHSSNVPAGKIGFLKQTRQHCCNQTCAKVHGLFAIWLVEAKKSGVRKIWMPPIGFRKNSLNYIRATAKNLHGQFARLHLFTLGVGSFQQL